MLAALALTRAMRVFAWMRNRTRWISVSGGVVLVLVGVLQVSGVWSELVARLQTVIVAWQPPI